MFPPGGRSKGTQKPSGAGLHMVRRTGLGQGNAQDAAGSSEDAAMMGPEEYLDEEGPEAEYEALLEKRVHTDYDKEFGDDFDDDDV
mmetsp:Transcript_57803/g.135130  ORF Transcript_57803/g.135130 Transcript_57803/m.135130 type:complete len:86 (+) Transcript_57803:79-336(+)|eukprot:4520637-Amphidinium_carterae.1